MNIISIILPVYNAEKYLKRCLDSLLEQTYHDFEIVAVDDGSTDKSVGILKEYGKADSRLRVFKMTRGNVSLARNFAISKIHGKYVTFIDADDWCESNYLMALVSSMESSRSDMSACGCSEISGKKVIERYLEDFEPNLLEKEKSSGGLMAFFAENSVLSACWSKMYKARIICENNIRFSEKAIVNSDIIFNLEYLLYCGHVSFIRMPLYNYVKYSSSLSAKRDPDAVNTIKKVIDEKMRVLGKSSLPATVVESALTQWRFRILAFSCYREMTSIERIPLKERIGKTLELASIVRGMMESGKVNTGKIKSRTMIFVRFLYLVNRVTLPVLLLPIHVYSILRAKRH
ncbi:MAG: glycosyltransferase family 2 protein [Clostridia bacterium]|nr:glycosyltransferase family 2 protein [Clostridia bacterium]